MFVIEFAPPMSGIEGRFNTFRLGLKWSKVLTPGDTVVLIDKKRSEILGKAIVEGVSVGPLEQMATLHAPQNHNQKGLDPKGAPQRLVSNMIKRYGPHKCGHASKVSVVALRRIE